MIAKHKHNQHEDRMISQRNLEFYLHRTTFAGMSGVQVFKDLKKPEDLYPLPSDKKNHKPVKIDRAKQALAIERVKQNKNFKQWQQKS